MINPTNLKWRHIGEGIKRKGDQLGMVSMYILFVDGGLYPGTSNLSRDLLHVRLSRGSKRRRWV